MATPQSFIKVPTNVIKKLEERSKKMGELSQIIFCLEGGEGAISDDSLGSLTNFYTFVT